MMKNFYEKVYDIVAQIPKGTVTTYGCIAMRLGKLAPMYVFGGIDAQKERLENEGVVVDGDKVDLKKYLWR